MDILKKYPVFIGVALLVLGLVPVYAFLVYPVQGRLSLKRFEATDVGNKLANYVAMGRSMPTGRMAKEYQDWHASYVKRAEQDMGRLKARSQKLHKHFESIGAPSNSPAYGRKWSYEYEKNAGALEANLASTVKIVSGESALKLERLGGRTPELGEINDLLTKYRISEELVRLLQESAKKLPSLGLRTLSFSDYKLSRLQLSAESSGAKAGVSPEMAQLQQQLERGEIDFQEYLGMIMMLQQDKPEVEAPSGPQVIGDVDRSAETHGLGYRPYPFGVKLQIRPADIPVFLATLFDSEQIIRVNGMVTNARADGMVDMDLSCELLDFSVGGG